MEDLGRKKSLTFSMSNLAGSGEVRLVRTIVSLTGIHAHRPGSG